MLTAGGSVGVGKRADPHASSASVLDFGSRPSRDMTMRSFYYDALMTNSNMSSIDNLSMEQMNPGLTIKGRCNKGKTLLTFERQQKRDNSMYELG